MRVSVFGLLVWCVVYCGACGRTADEASGSRSASGGVAASQGDPVPRDGELMRGVVVSCYRWGPGEWDGPGMQPLLDELQGLGVDAVQVHPYAGIAQDGGVNYRRDPVTPATLRPLEWAKQRGMTTFLKPHLAYWGSGFAWRGRITFDTEAQWEKFFREYGEFIVHQAELAERGGADVFAVGTELVGTLHREAQWRQVVAAVRAVYSGKLTYAANWDTHDKVKFWDVVDFVGIQCYHPITTAMPPTDDELRAGWQEILAELRGYSAAYGKPVLLAELGYAVSEEAALRPWDDEQAGDHAAGAALKLRCMRIALEQIEAEPCIAGVYLWKWFPGTRDHGNEFVLQYDTMRGVIRDAWGTPPPEVSPEDVSETTRLEQTSAAGRR